MANLPYINQFSNKIFSALKMYSRVGAFPLDPTSVLNSRDDLVSYIQEKGSYAYAGQVVTVANGTTSDENGSKDYSLYVIRSDKSIQKIGSNASFASKSLAEEYVTNNPIAVEEGEVLSVLGESGTYELYIVQADRTLIRVSFDVGDIPDISWANLVGKPDSTVDEIDTAVEFTQKFEDNDGVLSYDSKTVAYTTDITWDALGNTVPKEFTPSSHTHTDADIESISASKITGTISLDNLPHGALERCIVVETDAARLLLTAEDVQKGDTVKVNETSVMYFVVDETKLGTEDAFSIYTAGSASSVAWSGVTDTPTNLAGYGITDAVTVSTLVNSASAANAGKVLVLNSEGKLDVSITGDAATVGGRTVDSFANATHTHEIDEVTGLTGELNNIKDGTSITAIKAEVITGVIGAENLPASAFCKTITVADKTARLALTTADVHKFDTVIEESTGNMYFVINDTLLDSEEGYRIYTGSATSVAWDNVNNKPTTLDGYAITDAVNVSEVVTTAEANKILKLNSEGKLPTSITGDAATVGGKAASAFAEATHSHNDDDINAVSWSKLTGVPTTLEGYGITDAVNVSEVVTTAEANKILKLDADGKLPTSITGDAATVGGKAASAFAEAVHGHQLAEVEGLTEELANIKNGESITAVKAEAITGTISIDNLPHGALERCVVVANDSARKALTANDVQVGDTVKVTDTGLMYFVVDATKLAEDAGYEVYTAGSASSVNWSGVQNKPTTVEGYGITDAVTDADVTAVANADAAGKVIAVGDDGKLAASITGDAATVGGKAASAFAEATHTHEISEVNGLTEKIAEIDEYMADTDIDAARITSGTIAKERINVNNFITVSETEPTDLAVGGLWFEIVPAAE